MKTPTEKQMAETLRAINSAVGAMFRKPRVIWPPSHPLNPYSKAKTLGNAVIMGRRTWESLPVRPLPHRRCIVLSKSLSDTPGALMLRSVESLKFLNPHGPLFVIGGAEIYRLLMPWTDEVLLTVLDREAEGDTLMPEFEDQFGAPEILDRAEGVAEWRRYTRKIVTEPTP